MGLSVHEETFLDAFALAPPDEVTEQRPVGVERCVGGCSPCQAGTAQVRGPGRLVPDSLVSHLNPRQTRLAQVPEIGLLRPGRSIRSSREREPAAPIILRDGQHLADGSTTFIKKPLLGQFDTDTSAYPRLFVTRFRQSVGTLPPHGKAGVCACICINASKTTPTSHCSAPRD